MRAVFKSILVAALLLAASGAALGADWEATRLRGVVLELVHGEWQQLRRGDVVPDERVVRTLKSGRVTFARGGEVIELGGETQVQIFDRGARTFTTVKQYFGEVSVEADVRQVEHFSVQTPHLTAVVKGTRFSVTSDKHGAEVAVQRGRVAVKDTDSRQSTLVSAGQSAASGQGTPLLVSGSGPMPVVFDAKGKPVIGGGSKSGGDAKAAAQLAYADALAAGASVKEARQVAKAAEKAVERAEKLADKALGSAHGAAGHVVGTVGGAANEAGGTMGSTVSGLLGGGSNPGNSGENSGHGNSGNAGGNSGGGGSGNGNSGNSGSGNGNGNSGNGNSGNGNSGQGGGVGGLIKSLL